METAPGFHVRQRASRLRLKVHGHPAHDARTGRPYCFTPEDFLAYVHGVLSQPAFTTRFRKELESHDLRVPLTKDAGARLLRAHICGERRASVSVAWPSRPCIPTGEAARRRFPGGEGGKRRAVTLLAKTACENRAGPAWGARTRVVGAFPNGKSAVMLVAGRLRHIAASCWGTRRYLDMDRLREMQMGKEAFD